MGSTYEVTIDGIKVPNRTIVERDAISSPSTGQTIYNSDTQQLEYYNGSVWTSAADSDSSYANLFMLMGA